MSDEIQLAATISSNHTTALDAEAIENNNRELRVLFKIPVAIQGAIHELMHLCVIYR